MTRYVHEPAPTEQAKQFIKWCAANIQEWDNAFNSVARFVGSRSKWWKRNFEWRERHDGLSHAWVVCTKQQWVEERGKQ